MSEYGNMPTRTEHMAWCKTRALAYLPDSPRDAFTSMVGDLGKHPETRDHPAIELGARMAFAIPGFLDNAPRMREFLEGLN